MAAPGSGVAAGRALVLLLITTVAAACSSANGQADSGAIVSVVASTDVYGDVVAQIAGNLASGTSPRIKITSIIDSPAIDPHSYEANTRTQLELSRADLIVENGGGYDSFVDSMRQGTNSNAAVITAVDLSGGSAQATGNEHVWYDFPTVRRLAERIRQVLSARDHADAATFAANARTFTTKVLALESAEAAIKVRHRSAPVAITEPVPLFLVQACGLVNRTPEQFSKAVEEGTDVSPRVLADTLALFSSHSVDLLVYNSQTSGAETDRLRAAAQAAGIHQVAVSETLPGGQDYLSWMNAQLTALRTGLGR